MGGGPPILMVSGFLLLQFELAIEGVKDRFGGRHHWVAPEHHGAADQLCAIFPNLGQGDFQVAQIGGANGAEIELQLRSERLEGFQGGLSDQPVPVRGISVALGAADEMLMADGQCHLDDSSLAMDTLVDR
jgi:hypothetical protein